MTDGRVTARSAIAALVLLVLTNLLMRSTEFVMGRYITAGVPPVAAVCGLLLLLGLNQLLRGRFAKWRFSRAELMTTYAGLCLGLAITYTYGVRAIFPYFSALNYFGDDSNKFLQLAETLPIWFHLKAGPAVSGLYEGLPGGGVPWVAWRGVLLGWGSFLVVMFCGVACLVSLVRRPWMDHERLMFPVTQLPLALTQPDLKLARDPIFWIGLLIAALINATNIGHAFVDAIPAIKPTISLPPTFERPWTPLQSMVFYNRPEIYGFAYWVPNEILLSGWLSSLLVRAGAVLGTIAGVDSPGFPYTQEQSTGGYLALTVLLLVALRRVRWKKEHDAVEPIGRRWALGGLAFAFLYTTWFLTTGGVPRWVAAVYIAVIFAFVLVYARLRAEAGLALDFIYPYGYPRRMLTYAFGADSILIGGGGIQGLTAFYVAGFLARFHFPMWAGAFTMEGLRLAEASGVRQKSMMRWLTAAFLVGLVLAVVNYLTFNYANGLNYFEGKPGTADWRTQTVVKEFQELSSYVLNPARRDPVRLAYGMAGFAITGLLAAGRLVWLGFPLHPVGYVLATAYGDTSPMWWPFFVIWAFKTALLKYGGLKLYRKVLPAFVGFIVGHYLIGGLGWSLMSTYATPEIASRYYTVFG